MADDPNVAGIRGGKGKQKSPCPTHGTKAVCFCDTTQIDVVNVRSLTRTIIRAPMDNGWETRRSLLGLLRLFGPPSGVHSSAARRPVPTIGGSLKVCRTDYFSPSPVCAVWLLWLLYAGGGWFVKPFFTENFSALVQESFRRAPPVLPDGRKSGPRGHL